MLTSVSAADCLVKELFLKVFRAILLTMATQQMLLCVLTFDKRVEAPGPDKATPITNNSSEFLALVVAGIARNTL